MQNKADLHVHTNLSDGTFTPQEVIEYAVKLRLSAIAITDHDSVEGVGPALAAAKAKGIEVIPGIEFTTEFQGCEAHILGFFINYKKKWLSDELRLLRSLREKRMIYMLECLKEKGIELKLDEVKSVSGEGSIGRLHLAKLLRQKGYTKSTKEAFDKYIGNGKPCYAKGSRISPMDAIAMIVKAGGVAALAHPFTMGEDSFIPKFVKAGLKGIEVYHSDHAIAAVNHYKKIALEFGLIMTGGSDCHGTGKGRI